MIDPGGLKVRGADRNGAMRTLAENTDGLAILNTNDLDKGLTRISDDMSSYYLLGYYASNTKPDGRFRTITVRVKQPGVEVRARKGYRAPTEKEISEARNRVAAAPVAPGAATVLSAIDRLGRVRPDAQFQVSAALGAGPRPGLWVTGELLSAGSRPDEFMAGARASIEAVSGGASTTAAVTLKPGERTFLTRLELPAAPSGAVDVRVRLTSTAGGAIPLSEAIRIEAAEAELQPVMFRRGVTTGNRLLPAGAPRFSRTERIRLDFPVGAGSGGATPVGGKVLDRGGLATQVPVVVRNVLRRDRATLDCRGPLAGGAESRRLRGRARGRGRWHDAQDPQRDPRGAIAHAARRSRLQCRSRCWRCCSPSSRSEPNFVRVDVYPAREGHGRLLSG